jgi:type IV pilus assembly protein PilV
MIASAATAAAREESAGFALMETLVALLLLALGLFGAASTMIRGQAELRATLLATRAADLAGDLAEQLRANGALATRDLLLPPWQQSVRDTLSTASAEGAAEGLLEAVAATGALPTSHTIRVRWYDPALRSPRRLELPIVLSPGTATR